MSSIGGILSTAAGALSTHQKALAVTAHNISNAATPGYSRQRAVLTANMPLRTPDGMIGRGVGISHIEQVRDTLLDGIWRRENSAASMHGERGYQLSRIEQLLGEPSDTGLLATLDAFWNAWSDLAADPLSQAARSVLSERAQQVVDRVHQMSAGMQELRAAGSAQVQTLVDRANQLGEHIAELNTRIVSAEAAGGHAGDLRDARALALDELSGLVSIQVVERPRGEIAVHVGGRALVDGPVARALVVENGVVGFPDGQGIVDPGGRIGGLTSALERELAAAQTGLNAFVADLVTTVNGLHQQGMNPLGEMGVDFFDPAGLTAAGLGLSAEVLADPRAIAAGRPRLDDEGEWVYAAGHNDIALEIEGLRVNAAGNGVLAEQFSALVARTGASSAAARSAAEVHQTLAHQADIRREAVSGVSIDEELATLIRQQAAYSAAARVVSRVDEMLQTLIGMV